MYIKFKKINASRDLSFILGFILLYSVPVISLAAKVHKKQSSSVCVKLLEEDSQSNGLPNLQAIPLSEPIPKGLLKEAMEYLRSNGFYFKSDAEFVRSLPDSKSTAGGPIRGIARFVDIEIVAGRLEPQIESGTTVSFRLYTKANIHLPISTIAYDLFGERILGADSGIIYYFKPPGSKTARYAVTKKYAEPDRYRTLRLD